MASKTYKLDPKSVYTSAGPLGEVSVTPEKDGTYTTSDENEQVVLEQYFFAEEAPAPAAAPEPARKLDK